MEYPAKADALSAACRTVAQPVYRLRLFWGGLAFGAFGVAGSILSTSYGLGAVTEMGPGFFPLCVSVALMALGAGAVLQGVLNRTSSEIVVLRPIAPALIVSIDVLTFALLLDKAGLAPAVLALALIAQQPRWRSRPIEVLALTALLTTAVPTIFIYGLGLPFHLFRLQF